MTEKNRSYKRGKHPHSERSRFKKGDPPPAGSGRKPGTQNRSSMIRKVLDQVITGIFDGKPAKKKLTEVLLLKLSKDALTGDKRAMGMMLKLWEESEESMEREREAEYPFRDEVDRQVIDDMYTRMKASEA